MPELSEGNITYYLDPERYPLLSKLCAEGDETGLEVRSLLNELRPPRSTRRPISVLAKLLRTYKGELVTESVVVREISETGVVVRLPKDLELSLADATQVRLWLRAETSDHSETVQLELGATLVRMIGSGEFGADLAFKFDDLPIEERVLLYRLGHWGA